METSNETHLNEAIQLWRQELARAGTMHRSDLGRLTQTELAPEGAFLIASRRLGTAGGLTTEFAKVNWQQLWLTRVLWMVEGVMVALLM